MQWHKNIFRDHPSITFMLIGCAIVFIYYLTAYNPQEPTPPQQQIEYVRPDTVVYVCGASEIYHPTLEHESFAKCHSQIDSMDIKVARKKGLRGCYCSY